MYTIVISYNGVFGKWLLLGAATVVLLLGPEAGLFILINFNCPPPGLA